MVKLWHYVELEDIVHMAKIERQLKRKDNTCQTGDLGFFLVWRLNYKRKGATTSKLNTVGNKAKLSNAWRKDSKTKIKGTVEILSNNKCDIKCFKCLRSRHIASQCPNKRIMVMREHEEIESESDKFKEDEMPLFQNYSDIEYLVDEEETLMIK